VQRSLAAITSQAGVKGVLRVQACKLCSEKLTYTSVVPELQQAGSHIGISNVATCYTGVTCYQRQVQTALTCCCTFAGHSIGAASHLKCRHLENTVELMRSHLHTPCIQVDADRMPRAAALQGLPTVWQNNTLCQSLVQCCQQKVISTSTLLYWSEYCRPAMLAQLEPWTQCCNSQGSSRSDCSAVRQCHCVHS
jgi:hypothetical protein